MTYSASFVIAFAFIFSLAGCSRNDEIVDVAAVDFSKIRVDDLSRAFEFVQNDRRYEQKEFVDEVTNGLNRWVTYSEAELSKNTDAWKIDPLSESTVNAYRGLESVDRMGEFKFLTTDPYYLQQCYWITRLLARLDKSNRIKTFELYRFAADNYQPGQDVEDPVTETFQRLQPELKGADLESFVRTMKIFDWICRNVQLESSAPLSSEERAERELFPDKESGPESGLPGLGYQRLPWQVMIYGRGDYVERAKLMITCLGFWNIDAVMLATGDDQRPWAVGVLLAGKYYLFDTQLALPIPGKTIGSVATLDMVQASPEILSQLDLSTDESLAEATRYWVRAEDIKQLTALVYVSPEAISRRIKGVEDSLVGENRLRLTFQPEQVKANLPPNDSVTVEAWDIGFKTQQYRQAVTSAFQQSGDVQNRLTWFFLNEKYIDNFVPYRTARGRFLIGKFKAKKDERSLDALEGWQRLIYDDDTITSLGSNIELQTLHGIRRTDNSQSAQDFENQVNFVQTQMKLIRVDAKFFLAQCLFDNANENASGSWLEDLKIGADADRWDEGISYLLGRSYESRRDYDNAIKTLQKEDLRQAHGNILRIRMLKQLIEKVYGDLK